MIVGNEDPFAKQSNSLVAIQSSGRTIPRKQLHYCCDPNELNFLGCGFPLFFVFAKYCVLIIFTLILATGSFNLLSNYLTGEDCKRLAELEGQLADKECATTLWNLFSLANKQSDPNLILMQRWLNLSSMVALIVLL